MAATVYSQFTVRHSWVYKIYNVMIPLFIGTTEIVVIVLVVLLLFGGKKIPELMHGMGKGVKSFKDGMSGLDTPSSDSKEDKPKIEDGQSK